MNREDTRKAAMVMLHFADGGDVHMRNGEIDPHPNPLWIWDDNPNRYQISKRSGKVWLVFDSDGNCHRAYNHRDDAITYVTNTTLIVIPTEREEQ